MTINQLIRECELLSNNIKYDAENINTVTHWFTESTGINWNGQPWCAMTISYLFTHADESQTQIPKSAVCSGIVRNIKRINISEIRKGDIVIFDWNFDNENDHIGIVNDVTFKTIQTYDGNDSNDRFNLNIRDKKFVSKAYRPEYDVDNNSIGNNPIGNNRQITFPTIKRGSKGSYVTMLQIILNANGFNLVVDSECGLKTSQAIEQFQKNNALTIDGVVGSMTWKRLFENTFVNMK